MPEFNIPRISIGADPEVFIRDLKTGKIISAHDLLPGDKVNPHKVQNGAIQVDGTAGEFNIDPAGDQHTFAALNQSVLSQMKNMLGPNREIVLEPVAIFEKDYWDGLPEKPKELGCNPDYNGWTKEINPKPDASGNPFMRTASGHIHIGWNNGDIPFDIDDPAHFGDCCTVARQMDYYLGIQSLLWDPDPRRRTLYGKAGCFRPKGYGMEYRTLSNAWLTDKKLMSWVYQQAYYGITNVFNGRFLEKTYGDQARKIIDKNITDWRDRPEYSKLAKGSPMPPVPKKGEAAVEEKPKKKKNPFTYVPASFSGMNHSIQSLQAHQLLNAQQMENIINPPVLAVEPSPDTGWDIDEILTPSSDE